MIQLLLKHNITNESIIDKNIFNSFYKKKNKY